MAFIPNLAAVFNQNVREKQQAAKELYTSTVAASLQEVVGKEHKVIDEGPLRLVLNLNSNLVNATIGANSWSFNKEGHVMASIMNEHHQYSYIFANVNGNADRFWAVVFPQSIPQAEREQLEAIFKEHATYHVSERKQQGFQLPSFGEIMKKAQHDTQMLMDSLQGKKDQTKPATNEA